MLKCIKNAYFDDFILIHKSILILTQNIYHLEGDNEIGAIYLFRIIKLQKPY